MLIISSRQGWEGTQGSGRAVSARCSAIVPSGYGPFGAGSWNRTGSGCPGRAAAGGASGPGIMAAASPAHEDSSVLRFMRSTVPSDEPGGFAPAEEPCVSPGGYEGHRPGG